MYGKKNFDNMNISILTATITFIKDFEKFDQPLFFLTIIKTFLVPLSIPFLSFLFKKSVNILYFSTYCLQMTSKVVFVLLCFIHLPLFYFHVSLLVCKIGSSLLLKKKKLSKFKSLHHRCILGISPNIRIFTYVLFSLVKFRRFAVESPFKAT